MNINLIDWLLVAKQSIQRLNASQMLRSNHCDYLKKESRP